MELHGHNFIGIELSAFGPTVIQAVNPATGKTLPATYSVATDEEVDRAVRLASMSTHFSITKQTRVAFLRLVADKLDDLGDEWLEIANAETALPLERLAGERARTVNQMRLFASLVEDGSWVDARIDLGDPGRRPLPKPDLRRMLTPIGPIAVFGASNFPFAYSVAGGDTASAFAAGCPVIVKAHPAHPGASELAASAIVKAVIKAKMPEGTFSMVYGGNDVSMALVNHPDLAGVGFTGSLSGGKALMIAAASRAKPIAVHAEMGSVNPVFLLPSALNSRWESIADDLAKSVVLGVGQFCTNPGLIVAIKSPKLDELKKRVAEVIESAPQGTMLSPGIRNNYLKGIERQQSLGAKALVSADRLEAAETKVNTAMFQTTGSEFLSNHKLAEEVFGPETLLVECSNREQLIEVASAIDGQLTGSIHCENDEIAEYGDLIAVISSRVGRLIYNGFPTGVEVNPSMTHGGPYPATSDSRFTSVGTAAIYRFARPLSWQNAPSALIPLELQNSNPLRIRRTVNGVSTTEPIL